jgi:putative transposase
MEQILAALFTRRSPRGLEPVGEQIGAAALTKSKFKMSRKFVAIIETAPADVLGGDVSALDPVPLMIDEVHVGRRCAPRPWASTSTAPSTRWRG